MSLIKFSSQKRRPHATKDYILSALQIISELLDLGESLRLVFFLSICYKLYARTRDEAAIRDGRKLRNIILFTATIIKSSAYEVIA